MDYLLISFVAGILTVLAPCVFTLLPIILGSSLTTRHWKKPATIISALSVSIFLFTLLLRASTILIDIDPDFWKYLSGAILSVYGLVLVFPSAWGILSSRFRFSESSDALLQKSAAQDSFLGDVLVGISLGPVFSSCSPTYALIIATILPQTFSIGLLNLLLYVAGLAFILLLIAIFSQSIVRKLKWAVDPNGLFKRSLGILFVIIGMLIIFGLDKRFETLLLDNGLFNPSSIEQVILDKTVKR